MAVNLADLAENRANNFRIIRLVAACSVIFSHAYAVNLGMDPSVFRLEPLYALTGVSFSEVAVNVFFVTSGFLVARSLLGRKDTLDFIFARALRIYPGLIVAVLVMALCLGPAVTTLPVEEYLSTKSVLGFIVLNSAMLNPFSTRFNLPGVFETLPYPGVVNASLWTLSWEVLMYASLLASFHLKLLNRVFPAMLVLILSLYFAVEFELVSASLGVQILARFLAFFYVGVALRRYQARVPISVRMAIIATVAFVGLSVLSQNRAFAPLYTGYITLFLAYWGPGVIKRWSEGDDISYGIYIYAYPVQQLLVWLMGPHSIYLNVLLTLLITTPLAFLSWRLVEKPAIGLKAKLRSRPLFPVRGKLLGPS